VRAHARKIDVTHSTETTMDDAMSDLMLAAATRVQTLEIALDELARATVREQPETAERLMVAAAHRWHRHEDVAAKLRRWAAVAGCE
jgi:hypothetical protein